MASTTAASAVSHSVGSYLQNFYETKKKNKKQNKTLNDATIESRMTEIERMHTQVIDGQSGTAAASKVQLESNKKKNVVLCLKTNK